MNALLTLDDGASPRTAHYVRWLCAQGITPVLFLWGERTAAYRRQAVEAIAQGALVGNHSYTHPGFSHISLAAAQEEIERTEALIESLHREAGVARTRKWFRFPYGDTGGEHRDALQAYLRAQGFTALTDAPCLRGRVDAAWSLDPAEYRLHGATPSGTFSQVLAELDAALNALPEDETAVILMHDHPESVALVPDYLEQMVGRFAARDVRWCAPD